MIVGIALIVVAGLVAAASIVIPERRVTASRRLHEVDPEESRLARSARGATALVTTVVAKGGSGQKLAYALDRAGIKRPLPEVVLLVMACAITTFSLAFLLRAPALGLLLAVVVVAGAFLMVLFRAGRRKNQFADQLHDLTQLLATNLRAGHSLMQALGALASDLDEPARAELARAVNQVRVGRDLGEALSETAQRMDSEDFRWVAEAIAIHRQVGGNLADVLDTVGATIRERNEIRRQVKALSAEGRMSALILMLLPVAVGLMLSLLNPIYLTTFTQTLVGWLMLGTCVVLMLLGGLWLRKLIQVDF